MLVLENRTRHVIKTVKSLLSGNCKQTTAMRYKMSTIVHLLLFVTALTRGQVEENVWTVDAGTQTDNYTVYRNETEQDSTEGCCTTSLIFKFVTLIFGGLIVFTLVYLLILCFHDNSSVSFAKVRISRPPPCAIFMENFESKSNLIRNEKVAKYGLPYDEAFDFIDSEPLHAEDFPIMSPVSKGDKK